MGLAIAAAISFAAMSSNAAAQGHAPVDPGGANHGTPSTSHAGEPSVEAARREDRLVEQSHRAADEARDRSDEARADHPPNEHAADEARIAEKNAANKDARKERRHRKRDNRADHGAK